MHKKNVMLFERAKILDVTSYHIVMLMFFILVSLVSGCAQPRTKTNLENEKLKTEQQIRRGVVEAAKSNIGVKYKLGGTTPQKGFDCSGLVQWAYLQYGIHIPRTTWEQMKAGQPVKKENIQPSDILVFKIPRRGKTRYHTGIYAGEGKFVHSPRTGKRIHVENFSRYWQKRFVTARRIPVVS